MKIHIVNRLLGPACGSRVNNPALTPLPARVTCERCAKGDTWRSAIDSHRSEWLQPETAPRGEEILILLDSHDDTPQRVTIGSFHRKQKDLGFTVGWLPLPRGP